MLRVCGLAVRYGPIAAVKGVDLDVARGEIVALIGASGAGKTTTVKAIAGLLPFTGEVAYDGRPLSPGTAERNLRAGLALVEQMARHTLKIADRAYLLETGRVVFSGAAQDLAGNRLVTDSVFGGHVRDRDGRTSTEARAPS